MVSEPIPPSGEPVYAVARLLDADREAVAGYPVTLYASLAPEPSGDTVLKLYDPYTGISAGPDEDLRRLIVLSDNEGYARVAIEAPDVSGVVMDPSGNCAWRLAGDPYPSVGIVDGDGYWYEPLSEYADETIYRVPTSIGGFYRFELSQHAVPGSLQITASGGVLEEFDPGSLVPGQTFFRADLPPGMFIYDGSSYSIFVSDPEIHECRAEYEKQRFWIDDDDPYLLDYSGSLEGCLLYPDIKVYLHSEWTNPSTGATIHDAMEVVFLNPLSKLEMAKKYAEG